MKWLSRKEELVLLAIRKLGDNAYGVTIREQLAKITNKYWSIGAIYDVLDRLMQKGLLSSSVKPPLPGRSGRSRRKYVNSTAPSHPRYWCRICSRMNHESRS